MLLILPTDINYLKFTLDFINLWRGRTPPLKGPKPFVINVLSKKSADLDWMSYLGDGVAPRLGVG
jgi:hypothetical protein